MSKKLKYLIFFFSNLRGPCYMLKYFEMSPMNKSFLIQSNNKELNATNKLTNIIMHKKMQRHIFKVYIASKMNSPDLPILGFDF
ncbi:hypothetical protein Glove_431g18 [Diversispora epigaea]|uniref:Uncharacterized protein n=1 Tax=Diversispora epigaea TaxID=1348612 RepID=A0A397GUS7_9GLOM|nr:hypothetical protein Glove_431g18 [Diversispora epigaea]